ncbi:MAG: methionine adenosyltransferase [Bacteroidia bacterium]|nr:methionine adenosyltransferase [Bacteroidia bacterium]MCO5254265.1 methionine adenosyltransferase [Bacteroidota bacterium]MCZ2443694.1 methionine adenosyltransferase [Flavobacteriales bacterium]
MSYLFTSESVSEGHPDKVADQISDALLDNFLAWDPKSKVACETLVTTGQVVLAGEVKSDTYIDVQKISRDVIAKIGYTKSEYMFEANGCGIFSAIHEQSPDINRGVDTKKPEDQGAGDQGIMFGYACNETDNYMPLSLDLSHCLLRELAEIRREGKKMTYLRPDSKSQVTVEYGDDNKAKRVETVVLSTQHDEFVKAKSNKGADIDKADKEMQSKIKEDVINILIPRVLKKFPYFKPFFDKKVKYLVNPTGKFVIGGPHGDTGLTGRKIIVDTYGGKGAHGGGAFSGKDPSKVDRSAAYAMRYIAKNMVAAGIADEILVQVGYAIGEKDPVGLYVNTYGTSKVKLSDGKIAEKILKIMDLRPYSIEKMFNLRTPIYAETASYGHMGRETQIVEKIFERPTFGKIEIKKVKVKLFPWEELNHVKIFKKEFNIK